MRSREHAVKEKHAKTFQWALDESSNFSQWLNHGSRLFWISGKAGSGKSTLMKFLWESEKARELLEGWAGENKLVISRHFFWSSGTSMQKSYQGLLQSLCYDIFQACPDLLPFVCENTWSSLKAADYLQPILTEDMWSENEMVELIRKVGELDIETNSRKVSVCFFIDGLDEYHGEHDQLVEAVMMISRFRNVKVCVSSRPWNVFDNAFGELSQTECMLELQDLTKGDISAYVQGRLRQSQGFKRLLQSDARCSELASEIEAKADGVFLWVYLVINELSKGLTNRDDFTTLQQRLRLILRGLEPYFEYMFNHLDEFYRTETAQILRLAVVSPCKLPLLGMAVIFPNEPLAAPLLGDMTHTNKLRKDELISTLTARVKVAVEICWR